MQTLPARFAVRAARIKMKIVVLDGDVINPGDISWAPLEKLGEVAIYGDTPEDLIVERAAGAEVLVTNKVPLRSGTLSRLPDLRMVAVLATGYDIIDTADAAAHGIPVCNVVAYGVDDVAQHAWALLLELCRRTGEHTASVCAGEWKDTWCYWKTTPVCLRGRTLGVIGFGSIGRRVGELGHAFGMSVLANCRTPRNPPSYSPFAFASTDQIFQQADVISLHCPLTDATRALINAKALARMKPGAILINTARGPLLDEAAVAEELHFVSDVQRVVLLIRVTSGNDISAYDVVSGLFPDKQKDFVFNISETDTVLVKEIKPDNNTRDMEKLAASIVDTLQGDHYIKAVVGIGTPIELNVKLSHEYRSTVESLSQSAGERASSDTSRSRRHFISRR